FRAPATPQPYTLSLHDALPILAGRDDPARLRAARALPARVRGGGQPAPPPGDDSSGDLRNPRALRRIPDRALRGSVPAVALPREIGRRRVGKGWRSRGWAGHAV